MYRVLIVEDDPMVAMINEQYVNRNRNFHVTMVCPNGSAALRFLEKNPVELIILDVHLPIMNGLDTLREIRNRGIGADVIMVTAANDIPTLETSMHLGVIDYLVKPFSFNRFQEALDKYQAQIQVRKTSGQLSQQQIDQIIETSRRSAGELQPKGIQEKTLATIRTVLEEAEDAWMTGDEIADRAGLSRVTIRRYMNHLMESGAVSGAVNYETGGRPCMIYRLN